MTELDQARQEIKAALTARAQADPAFRQALLQDANKAIEALCGVRLPRHLAWKAVEETATTSYLVLPALDSGQLSDADLDAVAGGSSTLEQVRMLHEMLSNILRSRAEIGMTMARNLRG